MLLPMANCFPLEFRMTVIDSKLSGSVSENPVLPYPSPPVFVDLLLTSLVTHSSTLFTNFHFNRVGVRA